MEHPRTPEIANGRTGLRTAGLPSNGLQSTIAGLRLCNAAQCEVIANLEEYERTVVGVAVEEEPIPTGYCGGYAAEIEYLHSRRQALDSLIAAVERYGAVAGGLGAEKQPTND